MHYITEEEYNEAIKNQEIAENGSELKQYILNHVGEKLQPSDENITTEMVVEVMADEFPEFMLAIAEENWIRGYHQGLMDIDAGKELLQKENSLTALADRENFSTSED